MRTSATLRAQGQGREAERARGCRKIVQVLASVARPRIRPSPRRRQPRRLEVSSSLDSQVRYVPGRGSSALTPALSPPASRRALSSMHDRDPARSTMHDSKLETQPNEGGGDSNCSTMHNRMPTGGVSGVTNFSKTLNKMRHDGCRKVRESPLCAPCAPRPQPLPSLMSTLALSTV